MRREEVLELIRNAKRGRRTILVPMPVPNSPVDPWDTGRGVE